MRDFRLPRGAVEASAVVRSWAA